jgi:hypothetical protein
MPTWHNVPDRFVTIDGPGGKFEIAVGPRHPDDDGFTYVYRDEEHQFTFIGNSSAVKRIAVVWDVRKYNDITDPVRLTATEEAAIKENIIYFFKTRKPYLPERRIDPSSSIDTVEFNWGVVQ